VADNPPSNVPLQMPFASRYFLYEILNPARNPSL
ncbi:uncharacterized protein METZ01_LOCUS354158, partial [marine metagenome]